MGAGPAPDETLYALNVTNSGTTVAPYVELFLAAPNGTAVRRGVQWSDNFITLVPGETRLLQLTAPNGIGPVEARARTLPPL